MRQAIQTVAKQLFANARRGFKYLPVDEGFGPGKQPRRSTCTRAM